MKTIETRTLFNNFPKKSQTLSTQCSYSALSTHPCDITFACRSLGDLEGPDGQSKEVKRIMSNKVVDIGQYGQIKGQLMNFKKCLHRNNTENAEKQQGIPTPFADIIFRKSARGPLEPRQARLAEKVSEAEKRLWDMQMSLLSYKLKKKEILLKSDERRK